MELRKWQQTVLALETWVETRERQFRQLAMSGAGNGLYHHTLCLSLLAVIATSIRMGRNDLTGVVFVLSTITTKLEDVARASLDLFQGMAHLSFIGG